MTYILFLVFLLTFMKSFLICESNLLVTFKLYACRSLCELFGLTYIFDCIEYKESYGNYNRDEIDENDENNPRNCSCSFLKKEFLKNCKSECELKFIN